MSFASLRKVVRSARKGLCSTCSKTRYPQLEAAGAGHVGCLIYTMETLGTLIKDEHDVTAMHVAARKGHISVLIYLVENKLVEVIPRAKNGATPAHDAAGTGHLDCLRYIITHTMASPNDVDMNNATPLHWAVQAGHLKVVQWLVIDAKAGIDTSAKNGMTLFHLAASKNYLDIVRWLTLHLYKTHSKPRRLINAKDKNGATPIYHAARVGHVVVIQWLAEKGGGDPTIFTSQGLAPVHAAAIAGQLEAVQYLFQFGSATAPGGLRTTEGASTLHYAAGEGHLRIVKWLMTETKCNGNERDYFQSTPLHDAAENGQVRIIEYLCERGADCHLTDVEGNSAYDVAVKNGQSKASHCLATFMKQTVPSGKNGTVPSAAITRARALSRNKNTKAQMIDSYRNAPPHQLPVSVFDDDIDPYEDDEDEGDDTSENDGWTTLRDLMGDQEIEQMVETSPKKLSNEELKRRKLEEDIRKEKEERIKKRKELMKKEEEYEQEIRERILREERQTKFALEQSKAEQAYNVVEKDKKRKHSAPPAPKSWASTSAPPSASRKISLPGSTSAHELSRGIVDKKTPAIEPPPPKETKKKLKWWSRKSFPSTQQQKMKNSKSWDSSIGKAYYDDRVDDEIDGETDSSIPEPPPLPTVEYLMGKRAINLRKRVNQSLKDQLKERAAHLKKTKEIDVADNSDESDSHSSVASSRGSSKERHRHRRGSGSRHKRKRKEEGEDGKVDWSYNKLSQSGPAHIRKDRRPMNSPNRRKKIMERKPTPLPSKVPVSDILKVPSSTQQKLNFDAFDEMNKALESAINSVSPSSTSPLNSPSSQSSPSSSLETSPLHVAKISTGNTNHLVSNGPQSSSVNASPGILRNKRGGPKLQPHLQNKQVTQQVSNSASQQLKNGIPPGVSQVPRSAPIARIGNNRNKSQEVSPNPQLTRQQGQIESSGSDTDLTIDDMELQLAEMKTRLVHASANSIQGKVRPPSPEVHNTSEEEEETDSESDETSEEYTSSSEATTSSDSDDTSDSSDEELQMNKPLTPKRLTMVRNPAGGIGAKSRSGGSGGGGASRGFNRLRMLSRYPKLFRKRIINLDTIAEQAEEVIFEYTSNEDRAVIFHRIHVEKIYMTAWRKYMAIMKTAKKNADKIIQKKRRENLAKAFYAWIQVRNMGAVEKVDENRAQEFHNNRLMKKVFKAWKRSKRAMAHETGSAHSLVTGSAQSLVTGSAQSLVTGSARSLVTGSAQSLQHINAEERYLSWLNTQLQPAVGKTVDNLTSSLSDGTLIIHAISHASGTKMPKFNSKPKIRLHRQDNWKTAHSFMASVGVNVHGIEPADLANEMEAAIHNMFNAILRWDSKKS